MPKSSLCRSLLLSATLLRLSPSPSIAAPPPPESPAVVPRMMADFAHGKPEWTLAPGEKRFGWFYLLGPRKNPYSAFEGKRISILECMEKDPKREQTVIALKNDLSADVLGAFNLSSGTLATWIRPGELRKKGGALVSLQSTFPGSPQRGPIAWELKTEVTKKGRVQWVLTHALPGMSRRWKEVEEPGRAEDRLHVAVTWDALGEVELYLNAKPLPSEKMADGPAVHKDGETWPLERLRLHRDPTRALRQIALYDLALEAEGIAALYREEPLLATMVQAGDTARSRPAWSRTPAEQSIVVPPGDAVRLVQAVVLDAREEGRRAGGWLAVDGVRGSAFPWWYHGYRQVGARELVVTLERDARPNYVTGIGNFQGTLAASPPAGEETPVVALGKTDQPWFGIALGNTSEAASYTVRRDDPETLLEEIAFYRVEPEAARPEGTLRWIPLAAKAPLTLHSPLKQRELVSRYHPRDRETLTPANGAPAESIPLAPFKTWHLVSPPETKDFPLGEVGLRLATGTLAKPVRAKVVVHDPLSPWRDLAIVHLLLEPGAGERTIWLDLRDTLLPKDEQLWVSIAFDEEIALEPGRTDGSGSQLVLAPARDARKALALWREWEWRTLRDHFESISEPRPWSTITGEEENAWWLRLYTPAYERLDQGLRRLLTYFPEDPLLRAAFQFTHPRAEQAFDKLPLPGESNAPRWAVLMKENLRLYRRFVDWWIDHRQHPNGEFGNWYGDDTDLLQEWVNLAFITDPKGKYRTSFTRLATSIATEFHHGGGAPVLANGLNTRWTDALHAYEEGLNLQPPDFLLHYGDPIRFQRLLDTVARYDGFLLTAPGEKGQRRFTGTQNSNETLFFNTKRAPEGGYLNKYGYLFMQPGLVVGWYGHDPATWSLLESVARWSLTRTQPNDTDWQSIGMTLLHGMHLQSGEFSWLEPLIDTKAWASGLLLPRAEANLALYPTLYNTPALNTAATLKTLEANITPYSHLNSDHLGDSDDRFAASWVRWKLSGHDERHLIPALEGLYRKMSFLLPVNTEAELSGDRVAMPKDLLALLYLGGPVTSRNRYFHPDFAVSYEGFDDQFAAIVLEHGAEKLKLMFYNFDPQPKQGRLITWALEEGRYEVREGVKGEDEGLLAPSTRKLPLRRGEGFELTLPSRSVYLVEVSQIAKTQHEKVRGDAALAEDRAKFEGGSVTLPVYNLGSQLLRDVVVRLLSKQGTVVGEKVIGELPGMANWKLGEAEVRFDLPQAGQGTRYHVVIDPESRLSEITRRNNEAVLQIPVPPVD